jgi:hypothetical protein
VVPSTLQLHLVVNQRREKWTRDPINGNLSVYSSQLHHMLSLLLNKWLSGIVQLFMYVLVNRSNPQATDHLELALRCILLFLCRLKCVRL